MGRAELELKACAAMELKKRRLSKNTVWGIVCPKEGLIRSITRTDDGWVETNDKPHVYCAKKLERAVKSSKRFIALIGGRASTKSVFAVDLPIAEAKDNNARTYFLREFQSSVKNSVHSLVKSQLSKLQYPDFDVQDNAVKHKGDSVFEFAGISRNTDSVKSTHGFKRFSIEEAQFITEKSLTALTPSLRKGTEIGLPKKFQDDNSLLDDIEDNDLSNVSMMFIANPMSSADPFSQRFIEPYKNELDRNGYYEDDLHLIIKINYNDNPWFEDSGLEKERLWDFENRSRAMYDHIWNGEYNDSVEGSIINPEWFDAAVDAHLKLGFKPRGQKQVSHDPSDNGDAKAFVLRHGNIVQDAQENTKDDVNDGCDWAIDVAIANNVDVFRWDYGGLGLSLKRQVNDALDGKPIRWDIFNGASTAEDAESIYEHIDGGHAYQNKKNKDIFRNLRAQCYWRLRDRFYLTYRAVVKNDRSIPVEKLISISSEIKCLQKLRSETCRIPLKNSGTGLIQIMDKAEMKTKLKIESPNLADSLMMSEASPMKVIDDNFLKPLNIDRGYVV